MVTLVLTNVCILGFVLWRGPSLRKLFLLSRAIFLRWSGDAVYVGEAGGRGGVYPFEVGEMLLYPVVPRQIQPDTFWIVESRPARLACALCVEGMHGYEGRQSTVRDED